MSAKPALAEDLKFKNVIRVDDDVLPTETDPVVLHFAPIMSRLRPNDFFRFCQANDRWMLELTKEGDLIIMMPTGTETGGSNFELIGLFYNWVKEDGTGKGFDSNTGFILPNGAERSPDLAWVKKERWEALTKIERRRFAPLCPDFVVELRSYTDRLKPLQAKMEEYLENGAQLGWLIDPIKRKVYRYRPNQPVECLENPSELRDENVLPGFILPISLLWQN